MHKRSAADLALWIVTAGAAIAWLAAGLGFAWLNERLGAQLTLAETAYVALMWPFLIDKFFGVFLGVALCMLVFFTIQSLRR